MWPIQPVRIALLASLIMGLGACRNTAQVGRSAIDAANDAGELPDASRDATTPPADMAQDAFDGDVDAAEDAGFDASRDSGTDTGIDASDGGSGDDCPRPWGLALAYGSETRVVRFSFADATPTRCSDLRAEGRLPPSSLDVSPVGELIAVVGTDSNIAIDPATDTVRWSRPSDALEPLQAFALETDPPWLGIAYSSGITTVHLDQMMGIRGDGELTQEWREPARLATVSSYPEAPYAFGLDVGGGGYLFDPFTGMSVREVSLRGMANMHAGPGSPPRVAGGSVSLIVGAAEVPPGVTVRIIDDCRIEQAAPSPGSPEEVFATCRSTLPTSLVLYNQRTRLITVLLARSASDPELVFGGIGIAH